MIILKQTNLLHKPEEKFLTVKRAPPLTNPLLWFRKLAFLGQSNISRVILLLLQIN